MRLALSDADAAFRDEMRDFFTTKIPADMRERVRNARAAAAARWGAEGWVTNSEVPGVVLRRRFRLRRLHRWTRLPRSASKNSSGSWLRNIPLSS